MNANIIDEKTGKNLFTPYIIVDTPLKIATAKSM